MAAGATDNAKPRCPECHVRTLMKPSAIRTTMRYGVQHAADRLLRYRAAYGAGDAAHVSATSAIDRRRRVSDLRHGYRTIRKVPLP